MIQRTIIQRIVVLFLGLAIVAGGLTPLAVDANNHTAGGDTQVSNPNEAAEQGNDGWIGGLASAIVNTFWGYIDNMWNSFLILVGKLLLGLTSMLTWIAGLSFDYVIEYTVVEMSSNIDTVSGIDAAWQTLRDVANLIFIGILLYIAFKTILGFTQNTKGLLATTIIVALLVNFSLFFTKAVIDTSNILAIEFHDRLTPAESTGEGGIEDAISFYGGVSGRFMQLVDMPTLFDFGSTINTNEQQLSSRNIIVVALMGSFMMLVLAFVLFAASILFIIRYVVLIFVMILSPLAFAAYALPKTRNLTQKWFGKLISEAFYAPLYLALLWVTLLVLGSEGFLGSGPGYVSLFTDGNTSAITTFFNFLIVIAMLIASLIISRYLGAMGAGKAEALGRGASKRLRGAAGAVGAGVTAGGTSWALRNTLGRYGQRLAQRSDLKDIEAKGGIRGTRAKLQRNLGKKLAGSSFDARNTQAGGKAGLKGRSGGFRQDVEKQVKRHKEEVADLAPSTREIDTAEQKLKRASTPAEKETAQRELDKLKGVSEQELKKRVRKLPDSTLKSLTGEKTAKDAKKAINDMDLDELNNALSTNISSTTRHKKNLVHRKGKGEERKEAYAADLEKRSQTKLGRLGSLSSKGTLEEAAAETRKAKSAGQEEVKKATGS